LEGAKSLFLLAGTQKTRKICDDITNNQKYFVHRRNLVISSLREKTGGGHRPWQKNAQIVCIAILAGILATFYAAPAFALTVFVPRI